MFAETLKLISEYILCFFLRPPKEIKTPKEAIETTSTAITATESTSTTTTPVERSKTPTVYKSPKSPGQVHIAIATMRVGIEEKWGVEMTDRVYWNHQYYCKVHGYDYYVLDATKLILDECRLFSTRF